MPPPPASSSSVPKLKLKNFYDNELTSDITDYNQNCNDNLSKNFLDIDDDDFMFDHRLFSLYQFENENDNKFLNELATDGDSNVNLEKKEDEEDVTMKSNHERKESGSSSTSSFVNLINENNNNDYEDLDFKDNDYNNNNNDDDDDFELIEYDECKNFKMNSELINNKVYDRTNLIRFDFSSMTKLNDEYHSSSNECRLNLSNVKQAITTLKIPPKITTIPTQINDFINIDFKNNDEFILKETNNESNDCIKIKDDDKLDEKKQSDQKLGESIANITSTTLTPPSPSPPPMNISSPSKSEEILNIIKTTTVTPVPVPVPVPSIIIENKTNDINEQINNHFNASIANNKLLVSLPTTIMNPNNNITNNINNQTQSGRFLQSLNKIKNLNYSNDKIMQPLVNGTNNVITVSSTTIPNNNNNNALLSTSTSTSSSPSSSSSSSLSQTYLVKKQINNNNNINSINSITKSSSLFYSTTSPSSLPSSSSTSSSSSSSNIIINTPSTKLTNSSSPNLISLTGTIQQNNTNQIINSNNNSNNTNTIIVNGVLAKSNKINNFHT
jgi:hypothetical protein